MSIWCIGKSNMSILLQNFRQLHQTYATRKKFSIIDFANSREILFINMTCRANNDPEKMN